MAPKRHLPQTFPHKITLVISLVLCLCACASIVFGVISWTNHLWGYNFATGFWTGGIILLAGMFGIVCSCARNTCSVKTFMIISIFGCIASLGMIALACGGLDSSSGFYQYGLQTHSLTHIVHAVYLGLGILQLALCVLSDGLCFYYLFYENNAVVYRVGSTNMTVKTPRKDRSKHSRVKDRSSTGSGMPLMQTTTSESRKSSKRKSKTDSAHEDNSNNVDSDLVVSYATNERQPLTVSSLRQQEAEMASASPPNSHSGLSTFGRLSSHGPDQVSLIVHPNDDNASVADTVRTNTPDPLRNHPARSNMPIENHYAQTLLFEPPLPIEEDDELPPYEAADSRMADSSAIEGYQSRTEASDYTPAFCQNIHRSMSLPTRGRRQVERRKRTSLRSNIPVGRREYSAPSDPDPDETANKKLRNIPPVTPLHASRSADVLRNTGDSSSDTQELAGTLANVNSQCVLRRRFDHIGNTISDPEVTLRKTKAQSMHNGREKRLDRRRRALSAEIKLNKDYIDELVTHMSSDVELRSRTSSMGSGSSLYADSRVMATKFSLRTPMRYSGTLQANVPVPIRPPQAGQFKSPPPKPPRTFSVTEDDIHSSVSDNREHTEAENVFRCIEDLKNAKTTVSNEKTGVWFENIGKHVIADAILNNTTAKERNNENTFTNSQTVAVLDSGPVLHCAPPQIIETDKQNIDTMVVPISPVLNLPTNKNAFQFVENIHVDNTGDKKESENVSKSPSEHNLNKSVASEVVVTSPISPGTTVKKSRKLLFSFSGDNNVSVFDPSPDTDNTPGAETECVFELKEVSAKHHQPDPNEQTRIPSQRIRETELTKRVRDTEDKTNGQQNILRDPQKLKSDKDNSSETKYNIESLSNLRVRLPPLSPSERILQRKNLISNIEFGNGHSRPKVHVPEAGNGRNGARPKTKHTGLISPLTPVEQRRLSDSSTVHTGHNNSHNISYNAPVTYKSQSPGQVRNDDKRNYATPARTNSEKFHSECSNVPVVCSSSGSGVTTLATGFSPSAAISAQAVMPPDVRPFVYPVSSISSSPQSIARPSDGEDSTNVQGVLRLPQSQHARLLSNHEHPGVHVPDVVNNVSANGAINVQHHNDRPLFSMLL